MTDIQGPGTPPPPPGATTEMVELDPTAYEAARAQQEIEAKEAEFPRITFREGTPGEMTWRLRKELPAATLLDLALTGDPKSKPIQRVRAMSGFLVTAVHPEDTDDFNEWLRSADPVVDMEELQKIVEEIVEKVTDIPT